MNNHNNDTRIPFTMHPRVFAALGADLVTSDIIALMELVKNSYDAYATKVHVRIGQLLGDRKEMTIEVEDNGIGMERSILESVWSVVATPYRQENPISIKGKSVRRASGEKGLGRLSAARLGRRMEMFTQAKDSPCWHVLVDWEKVNNASKFVDCAFSISEYKGTCPWKQSGTLIRILDLHIKVDQMPEGELDELRNQLARFLPPFSDKDDFQIWLTLPGQNNKPARIEKPKFIDNPPYCLKGSVDEYGNLSYIYLYNLDGNRRKIESQKSLYSLETVLSSRTLREREGTNIKSLSGPFNFELRIWDLDKDALFKISERFNYSRKYQDVRSLITKGPYSGISLYRDSILVLPKTDANSDWLKLNLRRVSRLGTRLSVNQIIGYIEVTAEKNPNLKDTSDRERLVDNGASREFNQYMNQILEILEIERSKDHQESAHKEPPFVDLFEEIRDRQFKETIVKLAQKKASVEQFTHAAEEHERVIDKAVEKIETRLYYYSRLASLGTLAGILEHEVGNHSVTMDDFLNRVEQFLKRIGKAGFHLIKKLITARQSLRSVQRLSDTFSPLASQAYATRRRDCIFEESTAIVVDMLQKEIQKQNIIIDLPKSQTGLPVDPGEISAIMFNLLNNSIYWLSREKNVKRRILIELDDKKQPERIFVFVHDSGPGISDGDEERIFWPGITRKPNGLGMGLTVASELVAQYGGKMFLSKPGKFNGATFGFDLPKKTGKQEMSK